MSRTRPKHHGSVTIAEAAERPWWWRPAWGQAAVLCALVAVIYWPSLGYDFVWDDERMIPRNPLVTNDDGLLKIWTTTEQSDYWPVAYTSHWLEWRIWGTRAAGYRVANIALHAVNALLVWRLLKRLGVPAAWGCALVFAVHPLNIEAVIWILQRKTTLSTCCFLCGVWAWLDFEERGRWRDYLLVLVAFLAAMLTKTAAVMLPPTLLVLAVWQRKLSWRTVWALAPLFLMALALGLVGVYFQRFGAGADETVRGDGLASRIAIAGRAVWFYVGKALWPAELAFVYPRWPLGTTSLRAMLPTAAVLATTLGLAGWAWRAGTASRSVLAAWCIYLLNVFPALGLSNIYFMRYSLVADHWQYLALPALIALVIAGGQAWVRRRGSEWGRAFEVAVAVVVVLLTGVSCQQREIYRDAVTLWRDTLAKNPAAWIAYQNLAVALHGRGETAAALELLERGVAGNPDEVDLHLERGKLLHELRREEEALAALDLALRLDGRRGQVWFLKGTVLHGLGRYDEARGALTEATRLEPQNPLAALNLGGTLEMLGQPDDARKEYQRALTLDPNYAGAHFNLSRLLWKDAPEEALAHLRSAFVLAPQSRLFAERWAWILATHPDARFRDGRRSLEIAQSLCGDPRRTTPSGLATLAAALAECGEVDQAEKIEDALLRRLPAELQPPSKQRLAAYRRGEAWREAP